MRKKCYVHNQIHIESHNIHLYHRCRSHHATTLYLPSSDSSTSYSGYGNDTHRIDK